MCAAWTIAIATTSGYTPTGTWIADEGWDLADLNVECPYNTTYGTVGGRLVIACCAGHADDTLKMDWNLGGIAADATVTLTYDCVIAGTPAEPGAATDGASRVGILGLAVAGPGALRRKIGGQASGFSNWLRIVRGARIPPGSHFSLMPGHETTGLRLYIRRNFPNLPRVA